MELDYVREFKEKAAEIRNIVKDLMEKYKMDNILIANNEGEIQVKYSLIPQTEAVQ